MISFRSNHAYPLAAVLLALAGCGTPASHGAAARTDPSEPEPTTTFVPTPRPAPLFDLLTVSGDLEHFASAGELIKATKPAGMVRGTIESVDVGGTELAGSAGPGQGRIDTASIGIRPRAHKGKVSTGADRLVYLELYRSPLVTAEWLRQATNYKGRECLVLLADHPIARKPATAPAQPGSTIVIS